MGQIRVLIAYFEVFFRVEQTTVLYGLIAALGCFFLSTVKRLTKLYLMDRLILTISDSILIIPKRDSQEN